MFWLFGHDGQRIKSGDAMYAFATDYCTCRTRIDLHTVSSFMHRLVITAIYQVVHGESKKQDNWCFIITFANVKKFINFFPKRAVCNNKHLNFTWNEVFFYSWTVNVFVSAERFETQINGDPKLAPCSTRSILSSCRDLDCRNNLQGQI